MREWLHEAPRLLAVLAICLVQLGVADARPKSEHSASSSSSFSDVPIVLETFHGAHELDVAIIPCKTHDCAIQVRLYQGGQIVDRLALPVTARLLRVKGETIDEDWGADPGPKAWRTGFETDYVATAARPITLGPGASGLLVTQRSNIQPVRREHLLVLVRKGRLRVVWKTEESTAWSATHVIRGAAGSQDVAYFQISPDNDGVSDRYEGARLHWDAAAAKLTTTPLPDPAAPLYVLSLGNYESAAAAREALTMYSFCLASYWALDASAFPGHARGIVGKIYTRKAPAEAAIHQVKSCLPDLKPSVTTWIVEPPPAPAAPPPAPAPVKPLKRPAGSLPAAAPRAAPRG